MTQAQGSETKLVQVPDPLEGLELGRQVVHTDYTGVERVGIISHIADASTGLVNLVTLAKFGGESPTTFEQGIRFKPEIGKHFDGWRWPDKK